MKREDWAVVAALMLAILAITWKPARIAKFRAPAFTEDATSAFVTTPWLPWAGHPPYVGHNVHALLTAGTWPMASGTDPYWRWLNDPPGNEDL